MKKSHFFALFIYVALLFSLMAFYLLSLLGFQWASLLQDSSQLIKLLLYGLFISTLISLTLLALFSLQRKKRDRAMEKVLGQVLKGQPLHSVGSKQLDRDLQHISQQLVSLRSSLSNEEGRTVKNREEIILQERRRIARDLHDTVSQELFASSLILSGLAQSYQDLEGTALERQVKGAKDLIETAQKDLRILLLHLRPQELEGRSLEEGLRRLMQELEDKSSLIVEMDLQLSSLPQSMEEHIFRLVQEAISNSLKHAQANHFGLFIKQDQDQLTLRIYDDGIGFDPEQVGPLSYGLKNVEERVLAMGGRLDLQSAPKQGTLYSIWLPLNNRK